MTHDRVGNAMIKTPEAFMKRAFDAARSGMADGRGGPFGAAVVKGDQVIAVGANRVVRDRDPTQHAEVVAIRKACRALGHHQLSGCEIFATCEPCPMCLGAIYWARIDHIYFAATRRDAAAIGFDDESIYRELAVELTERKIPMIKLNTPDALTLFSEWDAIPNKVAY